VEQEGMSGRRQQPRRPQQMTLSHEASTGMGLRTTPETVEAAGVQADGGQGQARAPRGGKPQPVQVGAKTGRNDPCPCGSGKKFKHCHGG